MWKANAAHFDPSSGSAFTFSRSPLLDTAAAQC
jgi:hypothetical protein